MSPNSNFPGFSLMYRFLSLALFESTVSNLLSIASVHLLQNDPTLQQSNFDLRVFNENGSLPEKIFTATYITYFHDCNQESKSYVLCSCTFSQKFPPRRTYTWMAVNFIINSMWFITSLFLLISIIFKRNGIIRTFYYPWLLITNLVILADLLATIWYSLDLFHTKDMENYLKFIGCNGDKLVKHLSENDLRIFQMTPLVMSFIFSRGVIIWFLNIFLFVFVIRQVNEKPQKQNRHPPIITEDSSVQEEPEIPDRICQQFPSSTAESSYIPWVNLVYIPTLYKGNETASEKSSELYDQQGEHQYEKVAYLDDIPGFLNFEVPQNLHTASPFHYKAGYYNCPEFKPIKINYGSISIHVKRRKSLLPMPIPEDSKSSDEISEE